MMEKSVNESLEFQNHFQKFFAEYQKLQLEYNKLRLKANEYKIKNKNEFNSSENNNKSIDELKTELELEKLQTKSLKLEVAELAKNLKSSESRYAELLSIANVQNDSRLKELECEISELKETLDFLTSENTVLKDSEERTFKEKLEWIKQKEEYEKVVHWSKEIYDKLKTASNKNDEYAKQVESTNKFLNNLYDYFSKCQSLDKNVIDYFNKSSSDIEKKIYLIEKIINNLDENSNIDNNMATLRTKISDLSKENDILTGKNKSLSTEINELKNILNNNNISNEVMNLLTENTRLNEEISNKDKLLEKLNEKLTRNRAVWENNNKKLTKEIEGLDKSIEIIIGKLKSLPNDLKNAPPIFDLLKFFEENASDNLIDIK